MSRRRKSQQDDVNPEAWLATYADTITLLLTFFILLYSISAVDSQKLHQLSKALQGSLKGTDDITELKDLKDLKVAIKDDNSQSTSKDGKSSSESKSDYDQLSDKLNKVIEKNGLTKIVKVREEDRGIVLQLDETILFDSGKADLKEKSKEVLNTITGIIKDTKNDILVEGHTDNVPMHNAQFKSNWDLSTERAVSVVRYFIDNEGISPMRFAVKGYGEFKPLVDNSTPENRAINRRVDILVVEQRQKAPKKESIEQIKQEETKDNKANQTNNPNSNNQQVQKEKR